MPGALLSQLVLCSSVCVLVPRRAGDERTAPMSVSTRHASRRTDILTPRPRGQLALQGAIQESFASCAQSHETGKICSSPLTKIFPTDLLQVPSVFQTYTQCERANAASAVLPRRCQEIYTDKLHARPIALRLDPPSTCFRQSNITRTATSLSPILPVPGAVWRPVCTVACCDAHLWPLNGSYCRRCDDRRCMQAGRAVGCCTSEKDAGTRARGELRALARPCAASHARGGMSRCTQHGAWRLAAGQLVHLLS